MTSSSCFFDGAGNQYCKTGLAVGLLSAWHVKKDHDRKSYLLLHTKRNLALKFTYSEKATKFCEIFPLLLTTVHTVKSKGKISQNFVAFSEYMNCKK